MSKVLNSLKSLFWSPPAATCCLLYCTRQFIFQWSIAKEELKMTKKEKKNYDPFRVTKTCLDFFLIFDHSSPTDLLIPSTPVSFVLALWAKGFLHFYCHAPPLWQCGSSSLRAFCPVTTWYRCTLPAANWRSTRWRERENGAWVSWPIKSPSILQLTLFNLRNMHGAPLWKLYLLWDVHGCHTVASTLHDLPSEAGLSKWQSSRYSEFLSSW